MPASMTLLNEGLQKFQQDGLFAGAGLTIKLALFTNNHTPIATDQLGTNLTECVLTGYARIDITAMTWIGSASGGDDPAHANAVTFNFSAYAGGTTIFGSMWLVGVAGVFKCIGARLLDTPYVVPAAGGALPLVPQWTTGPHA